MSAVEKTDGGNKRKKPHCPTCEAVARVMASNGDSMMTTPLGDEIDRLKFEVARLQAELRIVTDQRDEEAKDNEQWKQLYDRLANQRDFWKKLHKETKAKMESENLILAEQKETLASECESWRARYEAIASSLDADLNATEISLLRWKADFAELERQHTETVRLCIETVAQRNAAQAEVARLREAREGESAQ